MKRFSARLILAIMGWMMHSVPNQAIAQGHDEPIVTTRHQVPVGGRSLRYTARAGRVPIRDNEAGDAHGQMFFVSYTLDVTPGQSPRPITFVWNGGPGSNAALVHLIGFGPKHIAPPTGAKPGDGTRWIIAPNPGTWLEETDLVFVDPIGTGYSRPTKAEYGAEFYQDRGDAESVAEFIRVYRTRFNAHDAPLFLAGESYGVGRAARVAAALQARGTQVRGTILIGLALPLGTMSSAMRTALGVPTLTVAAYTNGKLAADLQRDMDATMRHAESWALAEYAPALARRDSLSDAERDAVVRGLARFTGLEESLVDRKSLAVSRMQLGNFLLRREGKFVGQYDSRVIGPLDTTQAQYDPTKDPSLDDLLDDVTVLRYMRDELGYFNDLRYQGPFGGGYPPATSFRGNWMSVMWSRPAPEAGPSQQQPPSQPSAGTDGRGAAAEPQQPLRTAMMADPTLRVLVACGIYDLVCDYYANQWAADNLESALKARVTAKSYAGGHALYTDPRAHMQFKRDVAQFFRETLSAETGR